MVTYDAMKPAGYVRQCNNDAMLQHPRVSRKMESLLNEDYWHEQQKYEKAESLLACKRSSEEPIASEGDRVTPISSSFAKISADIESSLKVATTTDVRVSMQFHQA